jgi:hypothetical protein
LVCLKCDRNSGEWGGWFGGEEKRTHWMSVGRGR